MTLGSRIVVKDVNKSHRSATFHRSPLRDNSDPEWVYARDGLQDEDLEGNTHFGTMYAEQARSVKINNSYSKKGIMELG